MSALLFDSDDAACDASSCVSSGERQFVSALAEVIDISVYGDGAADDRMLPDD